jgi:hypothetical protein
MHSYLLEFRLQAWVHRLLPPLCDRSWNFPGEIKYITYVSKDLSDTEGLNLKWYRETRFEEMRIKTMLVRVAAEGRRDMAERIIEYSKNGRINTKRTVVTLLQTRPYLPVCRCSVEYRNSAVYIKYKNT